MHLEGEFRVGIEATAISAVETDWAPFTGNEALLSAIVRGRIAYIKQAQPEYMKFLSTTGFEYAFGNDATTFATAVVTAYEMVPQALRDERFTQDEMNAAHESIHEYITREEGEDGVAITINFNALQQKIGEDSPEFIAWVEKHIDAMEDDTKKADTLFGLLLAVAPFYFRNEKRKLIHELSQFGR